MLISVTDSNRSIDFFLTKKQTEQKAKHVKGSLKRVGDDVQVCRLLSKLHLAGMALW